MRSNTSSGLARISIAASTVLISTSPTTWLPPLDCGAPQRSHRDSAKDQTNEKHERHESPRRHHATQQRVDRQRAQREAQAERENCRRGPTVDPDRAAPQNQTLRHTQQKTADSAHDGKTQSPPEDSNPRDVHRMPCKEAPTLLHHNHS